jgi:hypothetical protein
MTDKMNWVGPHGYSSTCLDDYECWSKYNLCSGGFSVFPAVSLFFFLLFFTSPIVKPMWDFCLVFVFELSLCGINIYFVMGVAFSI